MLFFGGGVRGGRGLLDIFRFISSQISKRENTQPGESRAIPFSRSLCLHYCQRDNVAYKLSEIFYLPWLKFGWSTGPKCGGGRRPSNWQGDVQGELHEPMCFIFLGNQAINVVAKCPSDKRHKS